MLEEMGDVMFLLAFVFRLLQEEDPALEPSHVATLAWKKIRRRHPHVFGDRRAENAAEVVEQWNRLKEEERRERGEEARGRLQVPGSLPALRKAERVQRAAAEVGFDWPEVQGIFEKFQEELEELSRSLQRGNRDRIADEVGDLLFTAVNLSRFLGVDAEGALEATTAKFVRRFSRMERLAAERGLRLEAMTLDEMEALWQESKSSPSEKDD
jgi:tetrapyrrole methylase family protein/MazG family protein